MAEENTHTPQAQNTPQHILATWSAASKPEHERTRTWYIGAGIAFTLLIAYSIWTQAWTLTILLLMIAGSFYFVNKAKRPFNTIVIGELGFQFNDRYTAWEECNGFWMLQGKSYVELHIERKGRFDKEAVIQTGDQDTQELRTMIAKFIPELTERKERVVDMIERILKI